MSLKWFSSSCMWVCVCSKLLPGWGEGSGLNTLAKKEQISFVLQSLSVSKKCWTKKERKRKLFQHHFSNTPDAALWWVSDLCCCSANWLHHSCLLCWMQWGHQDTISQSIYTLLGLGTTCLHLPPLTELCGSKTMKFRGGSVAFLYSYGITWKFSLFPFVLVRKFQSWFSKYELLPEKIPIYKQLYASWEHPFWQLFSDYKQTLVKGNSLHFEGGWKYYLGWQSVGQEEVV